MVALTHMNHETDYNNHGHTGYYVCMVLDDELMAEYGQILVGITLSAFDWGHFQNNTVLQQLQKYRDSVKYSGKTWQSMKTGQAEETKSTTVSGVTVKYIEDQKATAVVGTRTWVCGSWVGRLQVADVSI